MTSAAAKAAYLAFGRAMADALAARQVTIETLSESSGMPPVRTMAVLDSLSDGIPPVDVGALFDHFAAFGCSVVPVRTGGVALLPPVAAAVAGRQLSRMLDLARKRRPGRAVAARSAAALARDLAGGRLSDFLVLLAGAGLTAMPTAATDPRAGFEAKPWRELVPEGPGAPQALLLALETTLRGRMKQKDAELVRMLHGIGREALPPRRVEKTTGHSAAGLNAADKRAMATAGTPLWSMYARILEFPAEETLFIGVARHPDTTAARPGQDRREDAWKLPGGTRNAVDELTEAFLTELLGPSDDDDPPPPPVVSPPPIESAPPPIARRDDDWLEVGAAAARLGCSTRYFETISEEGLLLPDRRAAEAGLGERYRAAEVEALRGRLLRGTLPAAARNDGEAALPVAAHLIGVDDRFLLGLLVAGTLRPARHLSHGGIRSLLIDLDEVRRLAADGGRLQGMWSAARVGRFLRVPKRTVAELVQGGVLTCRDDKIPVSDMIGLDREFVSLRALYDDQNDDGAIAKALVAINVVLPFGDDIPLVRRKDVARALPEFAI